MASMRKEMAFGFSLITVLLLVLGVLVYRRATALWNTPESESVANDTPIKPIPPVEGRPRVVMAQDAPPSEQPFADERRDPAVESAGAEEPYTPPSDRREQLQASFLPRHFDRGPVDGPDSAETPADDPAANQGAIDADGDSAASADRDPALADPADTRQTSLEMSEPGYAEPPREPADPQVSGNDLSEDPMAATADPLRERREDWSQTADGESAEVATSGALPAEGGYEREAIPDQQAGRLNDVNERRRDFGEGRDRLLHQGNAEPQRVAIENGKYTVAPNDNYWIISEKVYGNGGYFKALFEFNRLRYPRNDKLQVGDVLDAPPAATLAERYPDLCPRPRRVPNARQTLQPASTRHHPGERVYVVGEGDTLFDIARHELGRAARWTEIYDLNRDVLGEDFDYLRPGTELVLPRDRRDPDTVTRNTEPTYQR